MAVALEPVISSQVSKAKELAGRSSLFDTERVEKDVAEVLTLLGVKNESTVVGWRIGQMPYHFATTEKRAAVIGCFETVGGMITMAFSPYKNGENVVQVCFNAHEDYNYENLRALQVTQVRNRMNDAVLSTRVSGYSRGENPFSLMCFYHDEPPVLRIQGSYPTAPGFDEIRKGLDSSDSMKDPLALLMQVSGGLLQ